MVMDRCHNPRNAGVIEDADGVGEVGNPQCGDMMTFYIKVQDGTLEDVKFQTFGCVAAIAVSSIVREMANVKKLDEAQRITRQGVAQTRRITRPGSSATWWTPGLCFRTWL